MIDRISIVFQISLIKFELKSESHIILQFSLSRPDKYINYL